MNTTCLRTTCKHSGAEHLGGTCRVFECSCQQFLGAHSKKSLAENVAEALVHVANDLELECERLRVDNERLRLENADLQHCDA
jgi:hypothetical protein